MQYDFTTLRDRSGQGSQKWRSMLALDPQVPQGVAPMSVADMEFVPQPELVRAMKQYAAEMVYGYTEATDAYYAAVIDWMHRRHGYRVQKEWIVEAPGVVPALFQMVRAFTRPGEHVAILTPGYHPFFDAVCKQGRVEENVPLLEHEGRYCIDFPALRARLQKPETTLMILCNPHNPVGRVWTREELTRVCELCLQNDVFLISDEIHLDLILPGYEGTSVGQLGEPYVRNAAICTAPSKTFNIAGLQVSNILIADPARREKMENSKGYFALNMFSYKACEVVYRECEPWLDALLHVLDENQRSMRAALDAMGAGIRMSELQGTYLAWLDMRSLGLDDAALERFLRQEARWFINPGPGFGPGGEGHVRVNIACPAHTLQEALQRLHAALQKLPAYQK